MSLRDELRLLARGWRWGRPAPHPPGAPPPPVRTEASFPTAWARTPAARAARTLLQEMILLPALRALTTPEVRGRERLRRAAPPLILVANHASHLDTALVLEALPPRWRGRLAVGAAADYFFRDPLRAAAAAAAMGAFPIDRERPSVTSARLALRLLEEGWSVLLFPEGGRSPDGWLQELRPGAAFLAVRTGRPIVPLWIAGTEHVLPKGARRPRRAPVDVLIGDPLRPASGETARDLNARLELALRRLALEAATDWWTSLRTPPPDLRGPDAARWRRVWARGEPPRPRPPRWP